MHILFKEHGFTLVEALLAVTIFTIGLLGVAGLTIMIVRGNTFSKHQTIAMSFAQEKMEEVKSLGYAKAEEAAKSEVWEPEAPPGEDPWQKPALWWVDVPPDSLDANSYRYYKRQTSIETDAPPGMKTITVKVYWNADRHKVEFLTILAP